MMKTIAVIPARGGSVRLPGKNIKELCGKPLIAWTIEAALKSRQFDGVYVSTDDDRIAAVATGYGAIPIKRPAELSRGEQQGVDGMRAGCIAPIHALRTLDNPRPEWGDSLMLLQPTSPLRTAEDIFFAMSMLRACDNLDAVVSMSAMLPDNQWHKVNGAIYLIRSQVLLYGGTLLPQKLAAYLMPPERSVDIDTQADFDRAERLMRNAQGQRELLS